MANRDAGGRRDRPASPSKEVPPCPPDLTLGPVARAIAGCAPPPGKRRSSQLAQPRIHCVGKALTALSRPPKSFLGRTGRDVIAPPQGDGRAERGSPTCSGSHRPRSRVGPTTRPFNPLPLHTAQRVTSGVASRIGPAPSLRVTPTDGDGDRVRQPGAALARLASRAAAPAHPNDRGADHVQTPQRSGTGRRPKSRAQRCLRLAEHPLA